MKNNPLISLVTAYLPKTPYVWVYMLQQVEYDPSLFREWFARWPDYRHVIRRKKLVRTKKALILLFIAYAVWLLALAVVIYLVTVSLYVWALIVGLAMPFLAMTALFWVAAFGSAMLSTARKKIMKAATQKMSHFKGIKIAILGSYGKTTMKELLATILAEAKITAATPGNNNVSISHARWVVNKLTGEEEVLVIEFGEFKPGDIASMATMFTPDIAVLTGVAPNHLENYKDYDELKNDLASIQLFVGPDSLFVAEATAHEMGMPPGSFVPVTKQDILGWKISDVQAGLGGIAFKMKKDKKTLSIKSELLGEHLVEPLALAAAITDRIGATKEQIENGVAKTRAFEHRMQPMNINGAVIIDDTYNGNIEGVRAGLHLLSSLDARRKIYVTPGLVEQGEKTEVVHLEIGKLIAAAKPDVVVLMENSVRPFIEQAMTAHGFKGELRIEHNPVHFYSNIQYEIAAGDVVLMQNDWTDNYA